MNQRLRKLKDEIIKRMADKFSGKSTLAKFRKTNPELFPINYT